MQVKKQQLELDMETQTGSQLQKEYVKAAAAAAAAKSLQSCPTLWDPIDGSPPGSPIPGILQAILTPACVSSSLAFCMMYFAYKLNKQVTIYSLNILLSQFGTNLLFHVRF